MAMNRFYYLIKPRIPRQFQILVRRKLARVKHKKYSEIWPIYPGSEVKPKNWNGWPNNKKFALILTHDVELKGGHDKCRQLLELEKSLGFVSSFNFVPERYEVDAELRNYIVSEGFEVGVHGLNHDGKLFKNKKIFSDRAIQINRYLKEWNSVGFRAPAMHHNLDWISELNIEYDLSTFDTDPFEPQPDEVGTIFPFWVEGKNGRPDYIEMPYTMVQDFTLFILMKEESPKIWIKKLDWIAVNGGMALVNVHPDYLSFNNKVDTEVFPVKYYLDFLNYIKKRYNGLYWNALPKHIAQYYKENVCKEIRTQKEKVLMVVYSYFPQDVRPRREADALIKAGYQVDMICLRLPHQVKEENVYGVKTFRVDMSKSRSTKGKYVSLYANFFIRSFFKLNWLFLKYNYKAIHIHNMPDFLVFLTVIPKIFGRKVLLDLHDPSPEILMTKFSEGYESRLTKLLKWQEKMSIKFAHTVITTNKSFVDRFVQRGCPPEKINIVMNSPQDSIFNKVVDKPKNNSDRKKFVLMYHGLIVERHGLDILARAIDILKRKIPRLEAVVYGEGEFAQEFIEQVKQLKLESIVKYYGRVSIEKIAETIPQIDVGIIPNRLGPFTQINFPTRIFEYLCKKKPVIVPRTQGIKDYFDEDSIFYFDPGKEYDLANVIFNIYSDPVKTVEIVNRGFEIYEIHKWSKESKKLISIYEDVINNGKNNLGITK